MMMMMMIVRDAVEVVNEIVPEKVEDEVAQEIVVIEVEVAIAPDDEAEIVQAGDEVAREIVGIITTIEGEEKVVTITAEENETDIDVINILIYIYTHTLTYTCICKRDTKPLSRTSKMCIDRAVRARKVW